MLLYQRKYNRTQSCMISYLDRILVSDEVTTNSYNTVQLLSKLPTHKSGQDAAVSRGVYVQCTGSCCCTDSDAWGPRRVNSETSKQVATTVRSTLPPSSTYGDIASNWTRSEMLQRRRDALSYFVILCWQAAASPFWWPDARAKGGPSPSDPLKYATVAYRLLGNTVTWL